ncbi:hypothetical protein [Legionella waltersii]|nr:hypothetical protein [Legionella waltersii]
MLGTSKLSIQAYYAFITNAEIELHRMLKKEQLENAGYMPAWKQFYELAA